MNVYIKQLFLLLSCALLFQPLFAQATYAEKAAGDSAAISLKTVQAITTPDVISPQTINFDYLITHHEILQKVQEGYFIKKAAATIPDNNFCITVAEAKAWLTLDESQLPVNGRMPVYQQLVPTAQCTGVNKKVINGYLRNRCTDLDQERIERNHTYMEMLLRLAMV